MAYRVSLAAPAETDAYAAFEYIREMALSQAEPWLNRLFEAIVSLEQFPARCPIIPEAGELEHPVRHLMFGKGSGLYRIIFQIIEEDMHVQVLRVWHGSREALNITDIVS